MVQERRLADARLAADDQHRALAAADVLQQPVERLTLAGAPQQQRGTARPWTLEPKRTRDAARSVRARDDTGAVTGRSVTPGTRGRRRPATSARSRWTTMTGVARSTTTAMMPTSGVIRPTPMIMRHTGDLDGRLHGDEPGGEGCGRGPGAERPGQGVSRAGPSGLPQRRGADEVGDQECQDVVAHR